jgi:cytochrome c553
MTKVLLASAFLAATFAGTAFAADAASGRALYERFCARCHGPNPVQFQSGANITTADVTTIRRTIAGNPAMSFLAFLTEAQLQDIVAYLNLQLGTAGSFNYTDQWWNPAESGWGVTIIHRAASNQILAIVNHYDEARRPVWYAVTGGTWSGDTFTGPLYSTSGPTLGGAYDPASLQVRPVGTATFTFANFENATLDLVIDGRRTSRLISRQPF